MSFYTAFRLNLRSLSNRNRVRFPRLTEQPTATRRNIFSGLGVVEASGPPSLWVVLGVATGLPVALWAYKVRLIVNYATY